MQLFKETETTRTWMCEGEEAAAIFDKIQAANAAVSSIAQQARDAAKPIQEEAEAALAALAAKQEAETAALQKEFQDRVQASDTAFTEASIAESTNFHNWLWDTNPAMSRESLPMININQFAEGSGLVTILEKK